MSDSDPEETKELQFQSSRHIVAAIKKKVKPPERYELIIVIRGMIERVRLPAGKVVALGRSSSSFNGFMLDLSSYQAVEHGVSRIHAQLHMEDDHVFITDLGSRNGTFIDGERIAPHTATKLNKGYEIQLGYLPIQVLFRS